MKVKLISINPVYLETYKNTEYINRLSVLPFPFEAETYLSPINQIADEEYYMTYGRVIKQTNMVKLSHILGKYNDYSIDWFIYEQIPED